jgi:alpha-beta hydrolase superfamily lysophospholipase
LHKEKYTNKWAKLIKFYNFETYSTTPCTLPFMEEVNVRNQVFSLNSSNNHTFGVTSTLPEGKQLVGIVQIIPGMAEHAGRYQEFSNFLAQNGYGVFCADHPGAGITAKKPENLGVLPASRGWEIMLQNVRALYTYLRKKYPDNQVFIFGHSMGSILARHFVAVYPVYIQGLILSASFETPAGLLKLVRTFIRLYILITENRHISNWFNKLFYLNFNWYFRREGPTLFEWISSQREEIDAYVADPYCGYYYTLGFYKTLFRGIGSMKKSQQNLKYRKTLPLLNICGQDDSVGRFGKDIVRIHRHFYKQRFQNNTMKVFRGRHELLHDKEKEKVFRFLLDWMNNNLKP